MLSFRIGSEPEHKITINPRHITHIVPQGRGMWTWVYMMGDKKFLVDRTYDDVVEMLKAWEAQP